MAWHRPPVLFWQVCEALLDNSTMFLLLLFSFFDFFTMVSPLSYPLFAVPAFHNTATLMKQPLNFLLNQGAFKMLTSGHRLSAYCHKVLPYDHVIEVGSLTIPVDTMSKRTRILFWNIRGLNNPVKRLAVLHAIKRLNADVICLQETHLPLTSTPLFAQRQFCHQYHSTYSVYVRGVSLLIKRDTQFSVLEAEIDPDGCYVFLLCSLYDTKCVLAGLYIPPPFSASLLTILANIMSPYPGITVLVIGDLNTLILGRTN